jgi:RimJ/RimL family protein N-acetyltransferase
MFKYEFVVRKAKLQDAKELLKLFKSVSRDSKWLLSEPDEVPANLKDERAFIKNHSQKNSILIVAEHQGSIIGVLGATGGSRKRNKHVIDMGISVLDSWRGRGVGAAMMKRLFEWCLKAGIKKIKLTVMTGNESAIKFYKKLGFLSEGTLKKEFKIGRRYHDGFQMARFMCKTG